MRVVERQHRKDKANKNTTAVIARAAQKAVRPAAVTHPAMKKQQYQSHANTARSTSASSTKRILRRRHACGTKKSNNTDSTVYSRR